METINTHFQGKKIPKENTQYKCLSLILLDSFIKVGEKYHPQTLLEDCKHELKKNKTKNLFRDDLNLKSDSHLPKKFALFA